MKRFSPTGDSLDTALLFYQNKILEMILAGASLSRTLTAITEALEPLTEGGHGTVFLVDDTGTALHHAASTSVPAAFLDSILPIPIGPDSGSCGTAAWTKKTVFASDIATNDLWRNYRQCALRHGYRACWSTPIIDTEGTVQGTLCLYFPTPRCPSVQELHLLQQARRLASIAIQHHHAVADRTALYEKVRSLLDQLHLALQAGEMGTWQWNLSTDIVGSQIPLPHPLTQQPNPWHEYLPHLHPDDIPAIRRAVQQALKSSAFTSEFRYRTPAGEYRWYECRGKVEYDADGQPKRMHGIIMNITQRKHREQELRRLAHRDPLTDLANRHLFRRQLDKTVARGQRANVMFLDLDNFKHLNETLGHEIGDELLAAVGRRLVDYAGDNALVARLGGDEFGILLTDAPNEQALHHVAQTILHAMEEPFVVQDHEINTSFSIGISPFSPTVTEPGDILRYADYALFAVKNQGKAAYKLYDRALDNAHKQRKQLISQLRHAVREEQLCIHYQPIFALATGRIVAVEALLRWQHPTMGLVMPGLFIPLAEETGLIQRLGGWVLEQAAHQVRTWQTMFPDTHNELIASVNVSLRQFQRDDFCPGIEQVLDESGLPAHTLQLEITESVIMSDIRRTVEKLKYLRDMGTLLAIDDFGKGQSSLAHFKDMPLNTLKLDHHFTKDLGASHTDTVLVKNIIAMARELSVDVVAEGIESQNQLTLLQQFGCRLGQGFFLGKPISVQHMEHLLHLAPRQRPAWASPDGLGTKAMHR